MSKGIVCVSPGRQWCVKGDFDEYSDSVSNTGETVMSIWIVSLSSTRETLMIIGIARVPPRRL